MYILSQGSIISRFSSNFISLFGFISKKLDSNLKLIIGVFMNEIDNQLYEKLGYLVFFDKSCKCIKYHLPAFIYAGLFGG